MSLPLNFHAPSFLLSMKKLVGVGGGWFDGNFSVSFGPKPRFRIWILTSTKLNN